MPCFSVCQQKWTGRTQRWEIKKCRNCTRHEVFNFKIWNFSVFLLILMKPWIFFRLYFDRNSNCTGRAWFQVLGWFHASSCSKQTAMVFLQSVAPWIIKCVSYCLAARNTRTGGTWSKTARFKWQRIHFWTKGTRAPLFGRLQSEF